MTNGIRAIRIVSGLLATIALGGVMLLLFALIPPGSVYGAPLEKALSQSTPTAPTVLAVVRNQGAALYTRPGDEPIQTLVGGSLVSALLRSQNELWVLVETRGLVQGWVEARLLLAAGLNRLPVEQPTPEPTSTPDAEAMATATAEAIEAATSEPSDGATPDAQPTGTPETEAETDMASSTPELMPEATPDLCRRRHRSLCRRRHRSLCRRRHRNLCRRRQRSLCRRRQRSLQRRRQRSLQRRR